MKGFVIMKLYPANGEPRAISVTAGREDRDIAKLLGHPVVPTRFKSGEYGFRDFMPKRPGKNENPRFEEDVCPPMDNTVYGDVVVFKRASNGKIVSFSAEELKKI